MHSQNNRLACGGWYTDTSCEVFTENGWKQEPYSPNREYHMGWTLNNGSVILLGGGRGVNTTEIITPGVGTRPGFDLKYPS